MRNFIDVHVVNMGIVHIGIIGGCGQSADADNHPLNYSNVDFKISPQMMQISRNMYIMRPKLLHYEFKPIFNLNFKL